MPCFFKQWAISTELETDDMLSFVTARGTLTVLLQYRMTLFHNLISLMKVDFLARDPSISAKVHACH